MPRIRTGFRNSVFINCPFDDDYRDIFLGVIFTVLYFGLTPRYALERSDSSEPRISKILSLISECKYGVHDLSRLLASHSGEYYRLNMSFELGIDYASKSLVRGKFANKKILVLESDKYRFNKAISDLSGSDIKSHNDTVDGAVISVRNWLVNEIFGNGASGNKVWDIYNDFQAFLYDELVEKDGHKSVDDAQITEIENCIRAWLVANPDI